MSAEQTGEPEPALEIHPGEDGAEEAAAGKFSAPGIKPVWMEKSPSTVCISDIFVFFFFFFYVHYEDLCFLGFFGSNERFHCSTDSVVPNVCLVPSPLFVLRGETSSF